MGFFSETLLDSKQPSAAPSKGSFSDILLDGGQAQPDAPVVPTGQGAFQDEQGMYGQQSPMEALPVGPDAPRHIDGLAPLRPAGEAISKAADWVKDTAVSAYDAFVGENQYELPESGKYFTLKRRDWNLTNAERGRYARARAALNLARGPEEEEAAIKAHFPTVKFTEDAHGNTIGRIGNERFALNTGGASLLDMDQLITEGAIVTASTLPLVKGARIGGFALQSLATVAGITAGSVTQDLMREGKKDQPAMAKIDLGRAMTLGGVGLAFQLTVPIAGAVLKKVFGGLTPGYMKGAALTSKGKRLLKASGIDPDGLTPQQMGRLTRAARSAEDPISAVRREQGLMLPRPVTLTPGQASRDPAALAVESQAKKGMYGTEAKNVLLGQEGDTRVLGAADDVYPASQSAQQAALTENAAVIATELGGTGTGRQAGEGAAEAQVKLAFKRRAAKRLVDRNYRKAREYGTALPRQTVTGMKDEINFAVGEGFDLGPMKKAQSLLGRLDEMVAGKPRTVSRPGYTGVTETVKPREISVHDMYKWRARATAAAKGDYTGEGAAIRKMIKQFDQSMKNEIDELLLEGGEEIAQWSKSIALRKKMGDLYEEGDMIDLLTRTSKSDGKSVLMVEPDQAVNYIFSKGKFGSKNGTARELEKMKGLLGADSAEWLAIKEEAYLRLFKGARPSDNFSHTTYHNNLENALKDTPKTMQALFSGDEISLFRMLARTAKNVMDRPNIVGDINPSGTSFGNWLLTGGAEKAFGPIGRFAVGAIKATLRKSAEQARATQARAAAQGRSITPRRRMTGAPATTGAAVLNDEGQKALRQGVYDAFGL